MTTNEEYRTLLRRSLIVAGSCILAVVICYFWADRPVAFFVYDHHINKVEVFRWLDELVHEADRLYQLDRCRRFPHLVRRRLRSLLAGDLAA